MMSARMIRTPSLSASSCASLVTGTSNARMMPNFLQPCNAQQRFTAHRVDCTQFRAAGKGSREVPALQQPKQKDRCTPFPA